MITSLTMRDAHGREVVVTPTRFDPRLIALVCRDGRHLAHPMFTVENLDELIEMLIAVRENMREGHA